MGCPDWARLGDGGDNFCYLRICDIIKDKAKPSLSSPAKGRKKSKDSPPPLKELIFSLNYESNGLGNSLYSVPNCLIPNKSFHVAPRVVAIRAHYRLIRALISGIT